MKWLITGANGQLGKTLAGILQANGTEVESLARQSLDISNANEVNAAIERIKPDILVNCAAWTDVDKAETDVEGANKANATGAQNIARATKSHGIRLIHISTDFVFGADNKEIYLEEDPLSPVNFYGDSKAQGENLVSLENPEAVILRASWLYSPFGKNFPKAIIRKLITDESKLDVVSDQVGQPTSCISVSNTILSIASNPNISGILHGSSIGSVSRYGFAQSIAEAIGSDPDRIHPTTSDSLGLPAKRPNRTVLGHGKHDLFGIMKPASWENDLQMNIESILKQVELELK
jgi:dTDP-4-dehydrorhamnose reductase